MKGILTFAFLLLLSSLQSQTVTVSEDISIRNDKYYSVVGKMKNRFLLFRDKSTKFEVQAFNENLQQTWEKEIELDKKNPQLLEVIPGKDHFNILYKYRRKGNYFVKMHRYDAAAKLIDSMTILKYDRRFNSPNTKILYSENKNALLIYHYEQQTTVEACAFLLDKMEVVWKKKFVLKDLSFYRDYQELVLSDDGELFYILEKNNQRSKKENHHFLVYQCNQYNEGVSQFSIPVNQFLTYDVKFIYDNLNNKLVAAGLYSEKNKGRASGYFFLKVAPNQSDQMILRSAPFDEEYISNLFGKDSDKKKKGINDLSIQEVILRRDGGMLIAAERKREYERRMAASGRYMREDYSPYIVDYYYDDICLISIHPDGQTHWKTILHKKQYSQDDDASFSSFFLLKTRKNLRFLFNDEIKDNSTVSEYVVNGLGESDRNSVMSTEFQNIRLRFRDAIQVGSNELIIPSERRNRLRLVRVRY